ncbi:hypothetical protein JRQ81_000788 [Phrynocephalus forsythii]|uniref:Uncharacterized protein n=1 Tax=Phrynocephalus forsythii TaxID=171643 RepID=A0A9Q1B7C5_9SAUR|nr:hypothetical protein JRQ81_000788 [Phrynocephalus forsythii]
MRSVVQKLSERGHEIVVVIPEVNLLMKESKHYTRKVFAVPYTADNLALRFRQLGNQAFDEVSFPAMAIGAYRSMMHLLEMFLINCQSLLKNREILESLKESQFDALFTDPALPCGVILAEYLAVPSVYFFRGGSFNLECAMNSCPSPVSYVPRWYSVLTDRMTFTQRLLNFFISFLEKLIIKGMHTGYQELASDLLQKEVDIPRLYRNGSVWLLRYDFVFEYPRPVMPNMVFIGGINCEERKILSQNKEPVGAAAAAFPG